MTDWLFSEYWVTFLEVKGAWFEKYDLCYECTMDLLNQIGGTWKKFSEHRKALKKKLVGPRDKQPKKRPKCKTCFREMYINKNGMWECKCGCTYSEEK